MRLINALRGKNKGRPPIWLMRQAGRYLPEYRALRAKHTLYEMFFTPSIAEAVTLMPIERFGFDAAILFSDITAIAPALGLQLSFQEGPVVVPSLNPQNFAVGSFQLKALDPIFEAVQRIKQKTSVPLIGFCGGPFTVATYLVEEETLTDWIQRGPSSFSQFIDRLTDLSIHYVQGQIRAGVDVIQLFDSWANRLSGETFKKYSLEPLQRIIRSVDRPVIVYMRGSALRAESLAEIGPAAISVDEGCSLVEVRQRLSLPLQGNLSPELLCSSPEKVREETQRLLDSMGQDPGFIVNLSHGILPGTPLDSVKALVETVRNFNPSTNR